MSRFDTVQCVDEMCSKRRHVRLLCLLGTSCEVSPSAATGGDLRVRGRILGQEKLIQTNVSHLEKFWTLFPTNLLRPVHCVISIRVRINARDVYKASLSMSKC